MNPAPRTATAPAPRKRRPPQAPVASGPDGPSPADAAAHAGDAALLARLERCAAECEQVERLLGGRGVPELETIIKLHRVLILRFSLEAEISPDLLKLVDGLMKPVMDWARLEEKRKERELEERKYRDRLEADKAQAEREAGAGAAATEALKPETLEKIQDELSLL